jgi:hypothetical protein
MSVKEFCSLEDRRDERSNFYLAWVLAFFSMGITAAFVNTIVFSAFGFADVIEGAWIAAFTEPVITKFLPAAIVIGPLVWAFPVGFTLSVMAASVAALTNGADAALFAAAVTFLPFLIAANVRPDYDCWEPQDWWVLGLLGGLEFGFLELYIKVLEFDAFWESLVLLPWNSPNWSPEIIPPVFGHMLYGSIVIGALVLWRQDRFSWGHVAGALVTTGGLHFVWNTWFVRQTWFWETVRGVIPV